ncbi:glycosyltransferase family 2 protein [Paraburkholderia sp. DHOC27]|uniref:glycosyltransferase family 2 protein n=1 Tax=Paraburkholderia sp. DHOC27 TaxID=2303330 RepID=UPI000E3D9D62|nr:glycosyltransferase family 2 protein [Paraburkholderia sp. DHOC27]RFU45983.1 glycosyltransferase family 2 protein [Paraburkholderia sp. DHOC27]
MSHRSAAVIVTYEPEYKTLSRLISLVAPQVRKILIVDNASTNSADWQPRLPAEKCEIIRLASNEGIASALNRGFEHAQKQGDLEFCALFDQDSAPSSDMIDRLETYQDSLASRGPVAQIGPYFFEHNRNYYLPFIESQFGFPRRKRDPGSGTWTTADYLISSGALVSMAALKAVGPMDEGLFIDYVDIEWGLRARAAGYQSYGAFDVRMEHRIGEAALEIAGVKLAVHKPLRRYYYYRNAILLCRRRYIPVAWKVNEVIRLGIKFFIFSALSKQRAADFAMMSKGIQDGLRGKTGKFHPAEPR